MPLERSSEPFTDPGTLDLMFSMHDQMIDRTVKVSVTPEALEKLGPGQSPTEVFKMHRSALEQLASMKFDASGVGLEVMIFADDLK